MVPKVTKEIEDEIYYFLSQLPEDLKKDINSLEGGGLCENVFTFIFIILSFALILQMNYSSLQVLLASPKYIDSYFGKGTWISYFSGKAINLWIHQHTPCLSEWENAVDAGFALASRADKILSYNPITYFTGKEIKLFSATTIYLSETYDNHLSCSARSDNYKNLMATLFLLLLVLETAFTAAFLSKNKHTLYQFLKEKFCGMERKLEEECPNPPFLTNM